MTPTRFPNILEENVVGLAGRFPILRFWHLCSQFLSCHWFCFMMAVSAYCLQNTGTSIGRRVLLGLEIGGFVVAFPVVALFFFSELLRYIDTDLYTQTVPNTVLASLTTTTRVFCLSSACLFLGRPLFLSVSQHPCLSRPLLSSLGLVTALFGAAGTLLNVSKRAQNQGKVSQVSVSHHVSVLIYFTPCASFQPPRYHIDSWEEMLMDRDQRLTGHARKQTVRTRPSSPSSTQLIQHLSV
jgi:hypothetical protein